MRTGPAAGLSLFAERRSLVWISGRAEPEVQAVVSRLLATGATFVDAGASIGFFTLLAARCVGPSGTIIAFEPQPAAAASVRRNALLNGFENVRVVEAALTSEAGAGLIVGVGKATAHLADQTPGRGHTLRVDATTLDRFLAGRPEIEPSLVKIDVEGHEANVLDGMYDTLSKHRPAILIECHGDVRSVLLRLEDARFAVSVVGSDLPPSEAPGTAHLLAMP